MDAEWLGIERRISVDDLTLQETDFLKKNAGKIVEYKDAMPVLGYDDFEVFRRVVARWGKAGYVEVHEGGMISEKEACFHVSVLFLGAEDY